MNVLLKWSEKKNVFAWRTGVKLNPTYDNVIRMEIKAENLKIDLHCCSCTFLRKSDDSEWITNYIYAFLR